MFEIVTANPISTIFFVGSIFCTVYAYQKFRELGALEKSIDDRNNSISKELSIREKELSIREKALKAFQNQTGIDISLLIQLDANETAINTRISSQSIKAQRYINKLIKLNAEKEEAFKSRPIITAVGMNISNIKLFSQSKEEFLAKEQAICSQVALDKGLICHLSTQKTECKIIKVIDGDTFDVQIGNERIRIRVMGYDTPEVCNPKKDFSHWGIQASEAADRIVKDGKVFHVYLDTVSASKNWTNDRYGRTLAHLEVDGVLIGQKLIENGDATFVGDFPLDKKIYDSYMKAEYEAKSNNLGMWLDINRYKLEKTLIHQQKKWNLASVIDNVNETNMTKSLIKEALASMLGKILQKSKNSTIVHNENCHHIKRINNINDIEITDEMLESGNVRPCKSCNGDELALELFNK